MTENPLVIIPARGGSKGIPHKNIKPFLGRPLIGYTIDVALAVAPTHNIILSTDDEAIASVAREQRLPVQYRRPPHLGSDTTGSREVMIDVMDWVDNQGIAYDSVILLQPTSPLRRVEDLTGAMQLFDSQTVDMVVSVTEAPCNPYYDCFETDPATGYLHISKGDGQLTRRQQAPPAWQYNGAIYIINPLSLRQMPLGSMPRRVPYTMPRERSVDLDTPLDWTIAEIIAKTL